jgi:putative FmdB family regulatory protein
MPTYEFKCETCNANAEKYFNFTDEHLFDCQTCNKPMKKLFRATPAVFRGSGWGGK